MKNRHDAIMSTPLNTKICVERNFKGESDVEGKQQDNTTVTVLLRLQEEFEKRTREKMDALYDYIERQSALVSKNTEQINRLIAKTTNGWGDKLKELDENQDSFIPRPEFNAAMQSIRRETTEAFEGLKSQIATLKWIFGIGMVLISALIGVGIFV